MLISTKIGFYIFFMLLHLYTAEHFIHFKE